VRLTLLDTLYLAGGLGPDGYLPLDPVQQRFSDGSVDAWVHRVEQLQHPGGGPGHARTGSAVHSVRAVPPHAFEAVRRRGGPVHVHLSEQPAENEACLAVHGVTPTRLLADHGLLGPATTAVHAIHLTDDDVAVLGGSGTGVCACPTTEADLADGVGRFPELAAAGSPLSVGTDQHVTSDLLGEVQRLDQHERLRSGRRATFGPAAVLQVAGENGFRALAQDGGQIARGHVGDLVAVRLDSPRTAGADPAQAVLVATAADVHTVVVDGVETVRDGRHRLGDVGRLLAEAIEPLWADP
jgi:formiminoglutamate deiminase